MSDLREFLRSLSDRRLKQHIRLYAQTTGCSDRLALAQAELDRRNDD